MTEKQIMTEFTSFPAIERRQKKRIYIPFPASVEGTDVNGEEFRMNTVLDSLSADSLYLRMMARVRVGDTIAIVFRLSISVAEETPTSSVSVRGTVIRADEKSGGACGIAVKFKSPRRFIYPRTSLVEHCDFT
jgi:hypothetical protein